MALVAFVFASLSTALGAILRDMQGMQLIMNFMVLPIFFLSGALFPLTNLPRVLAIITRLDPLTYGVDALRGVFIAQTTFGLQWDLAVLSLYAAVFVWLGAYLFSKSPL